MRQWPGEHYWFSTIRAAAGIFPRVQHYPRNIFAVSLDRWHAQPLGAIVGAAPIGRHLLIKMCRDSSVDRHGGAINGMDDALLTRQLEG